jgi:signal transduction histidine kinase
MAGTPDISADDESPRHSTLDALLQNSLDLPRWIGWRLRALVGLALVLCFLVFLLAQWLTVQPALPFGLRVTPEGQVKVHGVSTPALSALEGQVIKRLGPAHFANSGMPAPANVSTPLPGMVPIEAIALLPSERWIHDPVTRQRHHELHQAYEQLLGEAWQQNRRLDLTVELANGQRKLVTITPMGWLGTGAMFWLLSLLAVLLMGIAVIVPLAGPRLHSAVFAGLAALQGVQLLFIGLHTTFDLFTPVWLIDLDRHVRLACDIFNATALVQIAVLHPVALPQGKRYALMGWMAALAMWLGLQQLDSVEAWWGIQAGCAAMGVAALALIKAALSIHAHPFGPVMRRLLLIALGSWILLNLAMWQGSARPDMQLDMALYAVMCWYIFTGTTALLYPFMSQAWPLLQEFSLLAASSTVAGSLDMLFVAVFSLGQLTSMTLALFLSMGMYLIVRRWALTRLTGNDLLTMEKLFQRLYRIAREVELHPDSLHSSLMRLMRELFDPLEVNLVPGEVPQASLRGNGALLLVPVPVLPHHGLARRQVLVLKHSHKGQQLFTPEDARLAERIMEQLYRALSFDQAVEQGRSEERLRIAQDLHDDIGARLLTLMYQAPNAESEEYIRHTIQDLKTLTRGLAAQSHTLSDAAAEWKRDLSQRLGAARCELDWRMQQDTEVALTMVQWSALTRIIRELVSNAISHAKCNRVTVALQLTQDQLTLSVEDNGLGRDPASWSHGLGLGGVRKRVKQLNGQVRWLEVEPKGIRCEVVIGHFSAPSGPSSTLAPTAAGHTPSSGEGH